jgi:hypothetical protein
MLQLLDETFIAKRRRRTHVLEERRLRPAYMLLGEVVAWQCSLCQRIFTIWEWDRASVRNVFDRHSCAMNLWGEFRWSTE